MPDTNFKHHEAQAARCRRLGGNAQHRAVSQALQQMEREYEEKARVARAFVSQSD
jgi:hypothetical protein